MSVVKLIGRLRDEYTAMPGSGAALQDLLRSASELGADLIVLGRRDGGVACLSQLREMLRDAPCHVLVVHPSAHAAVA